MKLENQVTSLELSKKLKELGVKQESLFYWVISLTTNYHISYTEGNKSLLPQDRNDFYSAFTVAELGEMLPKTIKSPKAGDKRNWQDVSHMSIKEIEEMRYVGILSIIKPGLVNAGSQS